MITKNHPTDQKEKSSHQSPDPIQTAAGDREAESKRCANKKEITRSKISQEKMELVLSEKPQRDPLERVQELPQDGTKKVDTSRGYPFLQMKESKKKARKGS